MIQPNYYTCSLWGGVAVMLSGIGITPASEAAGVVVILTGVAGILFAEIYFWVCLYRCWSILPCLTARTTPGKAVGFMFIPFFNFYWIFVAIRGLATDADNFLDSKNVKDHRISGDLSLAACILGIIPYINMVVAPILQNILIYQYADFFNHAVTDLGVRYESGKGSM